MITRSLFLFALCLLVPFSAGAEGISLDLGSGGIAGNVIKTMAMLTVISITPSILMMVTSFIRIIIVLSFVRVAMGTQQSPPNMVLASLAFFLTLFVMYPTFQKAYQEGIAPYIANQIDDGEAWEKSVQPFEDFMKRHVRDKDLALFNKISGNKNAKKENVAITTLIPAFMISELRRAFEIGFLIFLPFLVIDMVVASVLMSMGMMMLPPVMISLPFKIIFFVLIDGWYMLCGSLMESFTQGPPT